MDALSKLLDDLKSGGQTQGNFLGFLHVFIGRKISKKSVGAISKGMTWRELAGALKKLRWDPEAVRELGLNPDDLPPRDRQRFWYGAITYAKVNDSRATQAGNRFAEALRGLGYEVSSAHEG